MKRYLSHLRRRASALLLVTATLVFATAAHAQSSSDLFRGTWQIDTPNDGALILIVKRGDLASYFWGDNADRTVYQGSWTSTDDTATLSWPDGSQHRIVRDALGFSIARVDANQNTTYTVPAQQVPQEVLGQWAKPPTKATELTSARDKAKGYFGIWQIGDASDNHFIFIESDRSAASNWGDTRGLRGSWAKQGSELHIVWDSGHYSILRENERTYAYKRVAPGLIIEDDATAFTTATRVIEDKVPSDWLSSYQAERQVHTGGIAFSSRKNARAFYRGTWLVRLAEKSYERIEINRFGGLTTSSDRKLEGSWRMEGQDIFMLWDNGSRQILSPVGQGFIRYEYKPGRPLDGVPTQTFPAAPADASKLAEHLKGREDVARQMISLAEAAGIDPAATQDAGWGRTFARWAWPFSDETNDASTNALLSEGYEEATESDPWWWPFWSETVDPSAPTNESSTEIKPEAIDETLATPAEITESSEVVENTETLPSEAPTPQAEATTKAAPQKEKAPKSSKKSWVWPF